MAALFGLDLTDPEAALAFPLVFPLVFPVCKAHGRCVGHGLSLLSSLSCSRWWWWVNGSRAWENEDRMQLAEKLEVAEEISPHRLPQTAFSWLLHTE